MTDIEKFDRAVYKYLYSISQKIVYTPTSTAIREITKRETFTENTPWTFISFYRDPAFDIDWSRMNNPATIYGDMISVTGNGIPDPNAFYKKNIVQNIPLNLRYTVEIWASRAVEVQDRAVALISKIFMKNQVLLVPINSNDENGRFHILDVSWQDNSDLERETDLGKIYRHTISFTIDARLTLDKSIDVTKFEIPDIDIYQ